MQKFGAIVRFAALSVVFTSLVVSALGQGQRLHHVSGMAALRSTVEESAPLGHRAFVPEAEVLIERNLGFVGYLRSRRVV